VQTLTLYVLVFVSHARRELCGSATSAPRRFALIVPRWRCPIVNPHACAER
jgi:hypothetical protein